MPLPWRLFGLSKLRSQATAFQKALVLVIILAITFAAFSPALHHSFLELDDDTHLLENFWVRSLDWTHIQGMFTTLLNKTYIPLTTFSFALEYHFFGYKPFIYHLNNLLL